MWYQGCSSILSSYIACQVLHWWPQSRQVLLLVVCYTVISWFAVPLCSSWYFESVDWEGNPACKKFCFSNLNVPICKNFLGTCHDLEYVRKVAYEKPKVVIVTVVCKLNVAVVEIKRWWMLCICRHMSVTTLAPTLWKRQSSTEVFSLWWLLSQTIANLNGRFMNRCQLFLGWRLFSTCPVCSVFGWHC